MRRAILLYNSNAGRRSPDRRQTLSRIALAFKALGIETAIVETVGPGCVGRQACDAVRSGVDTVFACGGDGTVHDVVQGLIACPTTVLGIIPLGSANVLAKHLKLSMDPFSAAMQQVERIPQTIPIGKVTFQSPSGESSRYFIVMAGAGPDGALVYRMAAAGKHRLGHLAYYLRAALLFAQHTFASFPVAYVTNERKHVEARAVSVVAVRVGDLGGLFSPLVRGADIFDTSLSVTLVRPPAKLSLLAWFSLSWTKMHRWNGFAHTEHVNSFSCGDGVGYPVQVQADGEWLGRTPMSVTLIPEALRVLAPTVEKQLPTE